MLGRPTLKPVSSPAPLLPRWSHRSPPAPRPRSRFHATLTAVAARATGTLTGTAVVGKGGVVFKWKLSLAHLSGPATAATLRVAGGKTLAFAASASRAARAGTATSA